MAKPIEHIQARQAKLTQAYQTFALSANGKAILADLEKQFCDRAAAVKTKDGAIDMGGTLINEGARQCVLYIKNRMRGDNEGLDD